MESENTHKGPKKIESPPISDKEQADILIWHEVKRTNRLTPNLKAGFKARLVARRYIKITKDKFKKFFIKSGYVEKLCDTHSKYPKVDALWVEKTKDSKYQLKVQERGVLINTEYFEDYDSMIDYFVDWIYKTYNYRGMGNPSNA